MLESALAVVFAIYTLKFSKFMYYTWPSTRFTAALGVRSFSIFMGNKDASSARAESAAARSCNSETKSSCRPKWRLIALLDGIAGFGQ